MTPPDDPTPAERPCRPWCSRTTRRICGGGLLSGLPFAEMVLLAGFLMSAGMFLTVEDNHAAQAPSPSTASSPTR
ncbi:hypothetical protein ACSQ76_04465 [Roseovarius sp. B08]|uniref:hypothetical protein n=1 Tax=Roseovarius sp. B08 TaxID=3449223 RepID=UPI003EDC1ED7